MVYFTALLIGIVRRLSSRLIIILHGRGNMFKISLHTKFNIEPKTIPLHNETTIDKHYGYKNPSFCTPCVVSWFISIHQFMIDHIVPILFQNK